MRGVFLFHEANTAYDVIALAAEIRKARQRKCGLERQSAYLAKPKKARFLVRFAETTNPARKSTKP